MPVTLNAVSCARSTAAGCASDDGDDRDARDPRPRDESKWPRAVQLDDAGLDGPSLKTVGKLIWNAATRPFPTTVAIISSSSFVAPAGLGPAGDVDLLGLAWDGWRGPGSDRARLAVYAIGWDQEWP